MDLLTLRRLDDFIESNEWIDLSFLRFPKTHAIIKYIWTPIYDWCGCDDFVTNIMGRLL